MESLHSKKLIQKKPPQSSTQEYLDIAEIKDGVVVLKNGGMRAIIMVSSINFALKSEDEQNAIISSYVGFLNSLYFPLQIVIQSRELNIENYINDLKQKENNEGQAWLENKISKEQELEELQNQEFDSALIEETRQEEVLVDVFNSLGGYSVPGEQVNPVEYSYKANTQVNTSYAKPKFKACPSCGQRLHKDATACFDCGYIEEEKRMCGSCGFEVEEGEFVCPNCRSLIIN